MPVPVFFNKLDKLKRAIRAARQVTTELSQHFLSYCRIDVGVALRPRQHVPCTAATRTAIIQLVAFEAWTRMAASVTDVARSESRVPDWPTFSDFLWFIHRRPACLSV